jgi:nucleoside-diphosphate-sugar epimerase
MPLSAGGMWADITRMSLLGWQPELSLKAGIALTLNMLAADQ